MDGAGLKCFPDGFQYLFDGNSLRIKNITTGEQAEAWVRELSKTSMIIWRVGASFPRTLEYGRLYSYKKRYRCYHNTRHKAKNPSARKSRNTKCPASMMVKILRRSVVQPEEPWPCIVEFLGSHNHMISMPPSLQQYMLDSDLQGTFMQLMPPQLLSSSECTVGGADPIADPVENVNSDHGSGTGDDDSEVQHVSEYDVLRAYELVEEMFRKINEEIAENAEVMVPAIEKLHKNFTSCIRNKDRFVSALNSAFTDPLMGMRKFPPNIPLRSSFIMRVSSQLNGQPVNSSVKRREHDYADIQRKRAKTQNHMPSAELAVLHESTNSVSRDDHEQNSVLAEDILTGSDCIGEFSVKRNGIPELSDGEVLQEEIICGADLSSDIIYD